MKIKIAPKLLNAITVQKATRLYPEIDYDIRRIRASFRKIMEEICNDRQDLSICPKFGNVFDCRLPDGEKTEN